MFLYFDRQGTLKEQINNDVIRAESYNVNKIYIFWEENENVSNIDTMISYKFYREDRTTTAEKVSTNKELIQIPYNNKQDLKFFQYYQDYWCYEISLGDDEIKENGAMSCLVKILNSARNEIRSLGLFSFMVDGYTNKILPDEHITIAQWNELLLKLDEVKGVKSYSELNLDEFLPIRNVGIKPTNPIKGYCYRYRGNTTNELIQNHIYFYDGIKFIDLVNEDLSVYRKINDSLSTEETKQTINKSLENYYTKDETYTKNEVYTKDETYKKDKVYTKDETYKKDEVFNKQETYSSKQVDDKLKDLVIGDSDYLTYDINGNAFPTYNDLISATTFYYNNQVVTPNKNDYAVVLTDNTHNNSTCRYVFNGNWIFQYVIEKQPLSQAQLDALNSGITADKVAQIGQGVSDYNDLSNVPIINADFNKFYNRTETPQWNTFYRCTGWNLTYDDPYQFKVGRIYAYLGSSNNVDLAKFVDISSVSAETIKRITLIPQIKTGVIEIGGEEKTYYEFTIPSVDNNGIYFFNLQVDDINAIDDFRIIDSANKYYYISATKRITKIKELLNAFYSYDPIGFNSPSRIVEFVGVINASGYVYEIITNATLPSENGSALPDNLDTLVKESIVNNNETLTDNEKTSACDWLGALKKVETGGLQRAYGITGAGKQTQYPIISSEVNADVGRIPLYVNNESNDSAYPNERAVLPTGMPKKPYHCAPKKYVDDLFASVGVGGSGGGTKLYKHTVYFTPPGGEDDALSYTITYLDTSSSPYTKITDCIDKAFLSGTWAEQILSEGNTITLTNAIMFFQVTNDSVNIVRLNRSGETSYKNFGGVSGFSDTVTEF